MNRRHVLLNELTSGRSCFQNSTRREVHICYFASGSNSMASYFFRGVKQECLKLPVIVTICEAKGSDFKQNVDRKHDLTKPQGWD